MRLGVRLGNLFGLVLSLEVCLYQAKGLYSGSDIIFLSTLLRLRLGNKSQARPSVSPVNTPGQLVTCPPGRADHSKFSFIKIIQV